MKHFALSVLLTPLQVVSATVLAASAGCSGGGWYGVYGGERCSNVGEDILMACGDRASGRSCGARIQHGGSLGIGQLSMGIKAAPGSGVVTSFYLSNNGGMYARGTNWNEIDFEIMGMPASGGGTRVWTNVFTGSAVEHRDFQSVPFDLTAGFHMYTFDINATHVKWLVDGDVIRTANITMWSDMRRAIESASFQGYASMWGSSNSDPDLGVSQDFTNGMGKLDDNPNEFPVHAIFRPTFRAPAKADVAAARGLNSEASAVKAKAKMAWSAAAAQGAGAKFEMPARAGKASSGIPSMVMPSLAGCFLLLFASVARARARGAGRADRGFESEMLQSENAVEDTDII